MQILTNKIKQKAYELGFNLVGITPADITIQDYDHYEKYIKSNYYGKMEYLSRNIKLRKKISQLMPEAKSVICVGLNYYYPNELNTKHISLYAQNKDYHKIMKKKLKELGKVLKNLNNEAKYRFYSDTGPILEKAYAQNAGLGWIGKNSSLINKEFGSWFFLGELITNLLLEYDQPYSNYCGHCELCLKACPTKAIIAPYQIDSRKCISYLTIELRDENIPFELRDYITHQVYGCDLCQTVCPWNKKENITNEINFYPNKKLMEKSLSQLLKLTEDDFNSLFSGSPIKRTGWKTFIRNCIVVAGNTKEKKFVPILSDLLKLKDPILSEHIKWAINRIES